MSPSPFLFSLLAQSLPIRWQAPWLLPAVLALGAAAAAAVLWFYPSQVRPVRRPWRYVIPGLRLLAFTALAVMVAKPVALRARPADDRGVLLVLLDKSRSMAVADKGRKSAELVALADSLGLLRNRRAVGTSGVAADFERLRSAVSQAVRAQGDLDYARVSGRGVDAAEARVRKQVDDVREQGRTLAASPAVAAVSPAFKARLAPLGDLPPADLRGAWAGETRKRLLAAADAITGFRDDADRRLYDADPGVKAICSELERQSRFDLAVEALVRPGAGLLSKLGPDTQTLGFAFAGGVTPLGGLRPADPSTIAPPAVAPPAPVDPDDDASAGASPDAAAGAGGVGIAPVVSWSAHSRVDTVPDGVGTDVAGAVAAAVAAAGGKPIRGVVVLSDGRQVGADPGKAPAGGPTAVPSSTGSPSASALPGSALLPAGVPLIAVSAAGPAAPRDVAIVDLSAPTTAFLGETIQVRAKLRATGLPASDPSALRLSVVGPDSRTDGADERSPTTVDRPAAQAADAVATFAVRLDQPGVLELRAAVPPVDGEASAENNVARRWVRVLPDRIRVLAVAGTPGWDFQYLRAALGRKRWFAVESVLVDAPAEPGVPSAGRGPSAPAGSDAAAPAGEKGVANLTPGELTPAEILRQDVVILYDVSAGALSADQWAAVDRLVTQRGGSVLWVAGPSFNPAAFGGPPGSPGSAAAGLLPFNLALDRKPLPRTTKPDKQPGKLVPTWDFARSEALRPDDGEPGVPSAATGDGARVDAVLRRWQEYPGVWRVLPVRSAKSGVRPLLRDPDNNQAAAVEFQPGGGPGRSLYLGTAETWRWRQKGGEAEHERFWQRFVRYAAEEPYAVTRGRLSLDLDPVAAPVGQPIQLRARVLAPDGPAAAGSSPVAASPQATVGSVTADVLEADAATSGGERVVQPVRLTESADGSGRLRSTLTDLPPGRYRVRLKAAGQPDGPVLPLIVEAGAEAEMRNLAPDADRLRRIAETTGGQLLRLDQLAAVPGLLAAAADDRPRVVEWPIWDSPILFAFVVGCLGAEWALRKRAGLA